MELRIRTTGKVVSEEEFRDMHSGTVIPTPITLGLIDYLGADVVLNGPYPRATNEQVIVRDGVKKVNGKWFTNFIVKDIELTPVDANLQLEDCDNG